LISGASATGLFATSLTQPPQIDQIFWSPGRFLHRDEVVEPAEAHSMSKDKVFDRRGPQLAIPEVRGNQLQNVQPAMVRVEDEIPT
jgi:hypothetical protein